MQQGRMSVYPGLVQHATESPFPGAGKAPGDALRPRIMERLYRSSNPNGCTFFEKQERWPHNTRGSRFFL